MDVESLAKQLILKGMTEEQQKAVLDSIKTTMGNARAVQKQRIGENVQVVVQALKKIEADIRDRYDELGNKIEKRVSAIKDGKDGRNGADGKAGKDGRPGRDGAVGPRGADGLNGRDGKDGENGVSVTDAYIDFDGSLIIRLSSGQTLNVGEVVAPDIAEKIKVITNGGGTSQTVLDTLASLQTQINNIYPSQTGNAGKFLTTDGTVVSWSSVAGGLSYQGTWNASTNTPALASGVGVNGYYYITATAGSTNLDGITDWQIGDWLMFNGTVWQKIDQSNLVTSVNGQTGAVSLTTTNINEGTNQYYLDSRARSALSAGTGISYSTLTGVITNSAPDQTVSLTQGGTTTITGTYPSFTISSADQFSGTVTSVGGTGTVSGLSLSGTVTTSGNLTLGGTLAVTPSNFASQTANTFLAAPNGVAGVPTFRAVVAADIPTLNQNTTGTAANVTGVVAAANGGTGQSSYAVGDLLYASTTTALSKLADVATGNALISGGVGVAPSYGKIGLTTHISGILPVANGGTNASTAGIAAFNNITGYTATGATGTTSTNLVFSTSPTLITPALGTPTALVGTNITGTATAFNINGTVGATTPATGSFTSLTASGDLLRGLTTAVPTVTRTGVATTPQFQTGGNAQAAGSYGLFNFSLAGSAAYIAFAKSRSGTVGTQTALVLNDDLGNFNFAGSDGTSFVSSASITAAVDGTPATGSVPGRLTFFTAAAGAAPAERVRITSAGFVGVNQTTPGSTLDVKGTLRLSGATSGYVGLAPAAAAGSTTYTLPAADGTAGQVLSTNGTATLSWATSANIIRAWVNFDGTTNVGGFCTIRASSNVTTVADNGTGDYTVNFTTALSDTNFAVTGTCVGGSAANVPVSFHSSGINTAYTKTTSSVRFRTNVTSTGAASDAAEVDIAIIR